MPMDESQLKQFLADAGLLHARDFDAASAQAREQGRDLHDVLAGRYAISEDDLRRAQARILGIPYVSLMGTKLALDVLSTIPEALSRQENIVAYKRDGNTVEVAMLRGNALQSVDFLRDELGLRVLPRLTDSDSMKYALMSYQKFLERDMGQYIRSDLASMQHPEEAQRDAATSRLVDTILRHANTQNASHVHIEPRDEDLAVRYRVGGRLYDAASLPLSAAEPIVRHIKKISGMKESSNAPQEGKFVARNAAEDLAVRASALPLNDGERLALRLMREKRAGFTLESLGLSGAHLEQVHEALHAGHGLILVAAPEGHGLTTTLYTLLDLANAPHMHAGSVEDEIEYAVPRVTQIQARPAFGFSHAHGIRALMRQDADVIVLGELRDKDAAQLAVQAALHGRLVIAGIRALSAALALEELAVLGVDRQALASAVKMVIGQRLVRKLAERGEAENMHRDFRNYFEPQINSGSILRTLKDERQVPRDILWRDLPFHNTANEGSYRGNTGLFEIMPISDRIKDMLNAGARPDHIHSQARQEGMFTITEHGIMRAAQGGTTLEELARILG